MGRTKLSIIRCLTVVVLLIGVGLPAAHGQISPIDQSLQISPAGQSARDNVRAVAARAPGNLVATGVAQALEAADKARGGVEIASRKTPISIGDELLADVIEIIFAQLNQAIVQFENLLRLRAGRPLLIPTDSISADDISALGDLTGQATSQP